MSDRNVNAAAGTPNRVIAHDDQNNRPEPDNRIAGRRFGVNHGLRPSRAMQKFVDLINTAYGKAKSLLSFSVRRHAPPPVALTETDRNSGGSSALRISQDAGQENMRNSDSDARTDNDKTALPPRHGPRFSRFFSDRSLGDVLPASDPAGLKYKKAEREREAARMLFKDGNDATVVQDDNPVGKQSDDKLLSSLERMKAEYETEASQGGDKYYATLHTEQDDQLEAPVKPSKLLAITPLKDPEKPTGVEADNRLAVQRDDAVMQTSEQVETAEDHHVLDQLEDPNWDLKEDWDVKEDGDIDELKAYWTTPPDDPT